MLIRRTQRQVVAFLSYDDNEPWRSLSAEKERRATNLPRKQRTGCLLLFIIHIKLIHRALFFKNMKNKEGDVIIMVIDMRSCEEFCALYLDKNVVLCKERNNAINMDD